MEVSKYLRQHARTIAGKSQFFVNSFAKALEVYSWLVLFHPMYIVFFSCV
jgi:chaperonin GroEL (HSP60 family)